MTAPKVEKNKKTASRIILVIAGLAAVAAFFYFDLGRYLTLEFLKGSQENFRDLYLHHQTAFIIGYILIYIAVAALSLPGAAVLTLAGGAVFGFWTGLVAVSFASTIGASIACLVSRFLLRDLVERRFGDKLSAINEGIAREGAFYLFSLRLVPVFPFFVINLAMGLSPIRISTFYWVSQLGMLPGTAVYVNAGKELGKINSLSGILSPGLIASFIILGIFPLAAKKAMSFVKAGRHQSPEGNGSK